MGFKNCVLLPLMILASLTSSLSCTKGSKPTEAPRAISNQEAIGLLANDFAVLIDVREEQEVKKGMATQAQWVPFSKIESDAPEWRSLSEGLSRDKQIIFQGESGQKAEQAAKKVAERGYKTGYIPSFEEWKNSGLPVKTPQF